ncbi:hypothetical protein BXZ70DRAFT_741559 [Cristinia sonorae]|uniref:Uncharacterized protein n=1 Tax=Cristinia sonorae TaxID=1940300 RepID=A0A8K0XSZ1_9AGAR|nr:hypothetical protein BXZ70DRAFT_741559 [Cristinia sonorae]
MDGGSSLPPKRRTRGTLYVACPRGINSVQQAYAIIRGVERRFGRVRDFQLYREKDDQFTYRNFLHAELENDENWQELSTDVFTMKVQVPASYGNPGGVSLEELRPYLLPQDKVEGVNMMNALAQESGESEDPGLTTVDVKIQRTDAIIRYNKTRQYDNMGRGAMMNFGAQFVKWGGFYDPSRGEPVLHIGNRMEQALTTWNIALQNHSQKSKPQSASSRVASQVEDVAPRDQAGEAVDMESSVPEEPAVEEYAEPATASTAESVPVEIQPHSEPLPSPSSLPPPPPPPPQPPKPTRKERLLALARESAQKSSQPKPEENTAADLQAEVSEPKAGDAGELAERASLKDSLLKLLGKKW